MNRVNRRHFLVASSAVATMATRSAWANAAGDRVRVAFIGTGNQGMGLIKRVLQHDLAQIVAVCDVNEGSYGYKAEDHFYGREPAKKFVDDYYARQKTGYEKCSVYSDYLKVLERKDIDAVFAIVPDHWHSDISVDAINAGKDVYCEKPLSFTVRDGQRMLDAVSSSDRVCQTGSHERSNPITRFVCDAVREGKIGTVKKFITKVGYNNKVGPGPGWQSMPVPTGFDYEQWLGPAPKQPYHQDRCLYRFRFNYDYSGGQITNFGAHSNDMVHWAMNWDDVGPVSIRCLDAKFLPKGSLFNTATETVFEATYPGGEVLRCESGPEMVQARFEGSNGWIQTGYKGTTASDPSLLEGLPEKKDDMGRDPHSAHMANFIDCVKSRQTPVASFGVGHNSATLCHLANAVIRRFPKHGDESLRWNHEQQEFIDNAKANEMLG
ncbi:MAG: Gfo/Idh/MocA family oxidoreductase [Planctomycetota bacterium]